MKRFLILVVLSALLFGCNCSSPQTSLPEEFFPEETKDITLELQTKIEKLIEKLKKTKKHTSKLTETEKALVEIGRPAVPYLVNALQWFKELHNYGCPSSVKYLCDAPHVLLKIGPPAIPGLLKGLNSDNADIRRLSARVLGWLKARESVPALIEKLKDNELSVRTDAAEALGLIGDNIATAPLIETLQDRNNLQKNIEFIKAAPRLSLIQGLAMWILDIGWDKPNISICKTTVEVLEKIGDKRAIIPIITSYRNVKHLTADNKLLEDAYIQPKYTTSLALESILKRDPDSVNELLHALADPNNDIEIRELVVETFSEWRSDKPDYFIGHSIELKALKDGDIYRQQNKCLIPSASKKLVAQEMIKQIRYVEQIIRNVKGDDFSHYLLTNYLERIAVVLFYLADESVLPELIDLLKSDDEDIRYCTAIALAYPAAKDVAVPALKTLLSDNNYKVCMKASVVLMYHNDKSGIPVVIKYLKDPDEIVRYWAICTLEEIGDKTTIQPLIQILREDPDENDRADAAEALGKIGGKSVVPVLIEQLRLSKEKEFYKCTEALNEITGADIWARNWSSKEQKKALAKWEEWWQKHKGEFEEKK